MSKPPAVNSTFYVSGPFRKGMKSSTNFAIGVLRAIGRHVATPLDSNRHSSSLRRAKLTLSSLLTRAVSHVRESLTYFGWSIGLPASAERSLRWIRARSTWRRPTEKRESPLELSETELQSSTFEPQPREDSPTLEHKESNLDDRKDQHALRKNKPKSDSSTHRDTGYAQFLRKLGLAAAKLPEPSGGPWDGPPDGHTLARKTSPPNLPGARERSGVQNDG
jgi:hypothetical protein